MDETFMGTIQEPSSILAPKGQKRICSVTSWEWGKNVTVICAMNASGRFIPPKFIYPRQRMSPNLKKDEPLMLCTNALKTAGQMGSVHILA
jgi:hypothetical protein